ncbi:MAG: NADH-quinone oxidoreductase subunit C [Isosphaeraceae bacterium]|jgi:NADH-quinone oxidoreductase subunit C|nr:MAG: NADH-quinone oxidoreductase subunit C [Isosphaeraceae bacterium]
MNPTTAHPSPPTATASDPRLSRARALLEPVLGPTLKTSSFRDNLRIFVEPDQLLPALAALRDRGGFHLVELGGTDYLHYPKPSGSGKRFEVHYVLLNRDTTDRLILKVGVDPDNPSLPSATSLWPGADWLEREVFDMFGIRFDGHPDLRRILMPDQFTAFPLRKDYPLRGRGERHNFPRITRAES